MAYDSVRSLPEGRRGVEGDLDRQAMTTTVAKLRTLTEEIAKPRSPCNTSQGHAAVSCPGCVHADALNAVYNAAPALARLVVTLTEALEVVDECCGCVTAGPNDAPRKALAAVEALEL
ncbi:hypothetical protein LCGC14_1924040 [marine sediment metagenome]|uniref:Uncharacterized protein n=1 Tax=marine sediment metagenome TaxID=412755 RepID=A0A0F9GDB1_9ZZZZ